MVISLQDAKNKYGEILNNKWNDEAKWMCIVQIPDNIANIWINSATGQPTRHIYINKDAKDVLLKALQNLVDCKLEHELKTFDGCFNIRDVRAVPGSLSCHAYGLAIDLNASENPLGGPSKLSSGFVQCWKDAGWSWGGDFSRKDGMHLTLGW